MPTSSPPSTAASSAPSGCIDDASTSTHRTTTTPAQTVAVLVDAGWLAEHLDDVRVIDTRRAGDYLDEHIPGAQSFALDSLLVEDTSRWALHALGSAAQRALSARGIGPDDHAVLVDDADGSAALGALVCELAGMRRVSVLRGGLPAWSSLGLPVEQQLPSSSGRGAADTLWHDRPVDIAAVASFDELEAAVASCDADAPSAVVLDTRSQLEHEGIIGPPCCSRRGSIPGSVHLEWTAFLDVAGAPHPDERIREVAGYLGLEIDTDVIVVCHAGHRAALAAQVLRHAGFRRARASLGSWHEWSHRIAEDAYLGDDG